MICSRNSLAPTDKSVLMYFANCVLSVVSVLFVIVFSTPSESAVAFRCKRRAVGAEWATVFIFALVVIAALYFIIGSLYVVTNREIKRFDVSRRFDNRSPAAMWIC